MILIMSALIETLSGMSARSRAVPAGASLFRQGDPVLSMFIVVSGEVRLVRLLPHGLALTLQRARSGAILAEASLFAAKYHCDAVATDDAGLLVNPRVRIEAAMHSSPRFARDWSRHVTAEIQRIRTTAEILSLKTIAQRLDAWLALNDDVLPPKGQWRRIASDIGVTPEALYRELARRR